MPASKCRLSSFLPSSAILLSSTHDPQAPPLPLILFLLLHTLLLLPSPYNLVFPRSEVLFIFFLSLPPTFSLTLFCYRRPQFNITPLKVPSRLPPRPSSTRTASFTNSSFLSSLSLAFFTYYHSHPHTLTFLRSKFRLLFLHLSLLLLLRLLCFPLPTLPSYPLPSTSAFTLFCLIALLPPPPRLAPSLMNVQHDPAEAKQMSRACVCWVWLVSSWLGVLGLLGRECGEGEGLLGTGRLLLVLAAAWSSLFGGLSLKLGWNSAGICCARVFLERQKSWRS